LAKLGLSGVKRTKFGLSPPIVIKVKVHTSSRKKEEAEERKEQPKNRDRARITKSRALQNATVEKSEKVRKLDRERSDTA